MRFVVDTHWTSQNKQSRAFEAVVVEAPTADDAANAAIQKLFEARGGYVSVRGVNPAPEDGVAAAEAEPPKREKLTLKRNG